MELWIRSQNKQLIKKVKYEICYEERNGHHYVKVDGEILGSYKTRDRAMCILETIEGQMVDYNVDICYQMPKE